MTNRREFLKLSGAAAMATVAPASGSAGDTMLRTRRIPGTDESLPIIGLGNSQAFIKGDISASSAVLETFFRHGGAYVDVSGQSRYTVGRIVADKDMQQQSFLGNYLAGQNITQLRTEIAELQAIQGGGALDLSMKRDVSDLTARADEFRALREEGLIRHIGIGRPHKRFYPAIMQLMKDGAVDFIQVNYSLMEPDAADRILPLARDLDIAVVINRPFINGKYFDLIKGHELPGWASEFECASWAQFSLKYIVSNPAVNCVLTETTNPKHVIDNLGAGIGKLPDRKMREKMRDHFLSLV